MNPEFLIFVGGILHFGILLASAMLPKVLQWKSSLRGLDRLSQQIIWVHGGFIVLVLIGLGTLSVLFAGDLISGDPLARGVCLFIGLFWTVRLVVQLLVFDAKAHLSTALRKIGYHGLTVVFLYNSIVYSLSASGVFATRLLWF